LPGFPFALLWVSAHRNDSLAYDSHFQVIARLVKATEAISAKNPNPDKPEPK
jgi:hypothetical protein